MKLLCYGLLTAGLLVLPSFADDVIDKTKDATKKAGRVTADKAEDVGDATVLARRRSAIKLRTWAKLPGQNQARRSCDSRQG